jgi:hypothetical protein
MVAIIASVVMVADMVVAMEMAMDTVSIFFKLLTFIIIMLQCNK